MSFSYRQRYFLEKIRSTMDTLQKISKSDLSSSNYLKNVYLIDTAHDDVISALDEIIKDEPTMEDVYI